MKISPINNIYNINNPRHKKLENSTVHPNGTHSSYSQANFAYFQTFKNRLSVPFDSRNRKFNIPMQPNTYYYINENACFDLGGYFLDLSNPLVEKRISSLKNGESIIFGSEATSLKGMHDLVSKKHLEIHRTENSELIARDLNSDDGSIILPPAKKSISYDYQNCKEPLYIPTINAVKLPENCQLILGKDAIIDMRNPKIKNLINSNKTIDIGRGIENDVQIDEFHGHTSKKHLRIQKFKGDIYAQDLNSTNGTIFVPENYIQPFYWGVDDIELSQSNMNDCFLLASIYALSKNPHGQKILKNMVEIDERGNYIVTFFDNKRYIIRQNELGGQYLPNSKKKQVKISVNGSPELKAIERAYAKKLREPKDSGQTLFMAIDNGGCTPSALLDLAGAYSKTYDSEYCNLKKILKKFSKEPNQDRKILTCYTSWDSYFGDFADAKHRFPTGHTYALINNNPKKEEITVVNPHDTRKQLTISWDEFASIFSHLVISEI